MPLPSRKSLVIAGCIATLAAPSFVAAQQQMVVQRTRIKGDVAPPGWKAPKLAGGIPDLQGAWTNATLTPFARAATYGDRLVMTEEEAAKLEGNNDAFLAERNKPTNPNFTIADLPVDCGRGFVGVSCGYDNAWTDPGETVMRVRGQPRTSFLTTPNGQIPPRKAGAPVAAAGGRGGGGAAAAGGAGRMGPNENPEQRSLGERCITSFGSSAGPVMRPLLYNNTYQIVQSKDAVAILVEMVHDVRVIRLNSQHRTDGVRPWYGDSIGRYEGDTLVVESTNFPRQQALVGSWENLKLTERFTRVAPGRILYQFSVEDPTLWDKPWGGEYEFGAAQGGVYEYACHEGNYGLENILAGARNDERVAAAQAASGRGTQ